MSDHPGLTADDGHFAEQFPLSPMDDFLVHQTPDPVRVMWTGDPRAYERYWMVCHDAAGEVVIATGGSFYPNLDRAEAYAIVNVRGRHTAVRSFRSIGADRADLRIGPIAPQIVRGLREWRYVLEPNEWGISYDLTFTDTTRQVFREPLSNSAAGTPPGRRNDVTSGFECFGTVCGLGRRGRRADRAGPRLGGHPRPPLGHRARRRRPGDVARRAAARRHERQRVRRLRRLDALG